MFSVSPDMFKGQLPALLTQIQGGTLCLSNELYTRNLNRAFSLQTHSVVSFLWDVDQGAAPLTHGGDLLLPVP